MTSNLTELKALKNNLRSSAESGMISADLLSQIEIMIDQAYLDRHNHEISYDEKNDNYRTVVDLPKGSEKRYRWMKCKRREDLEKKLIKYYKEAGSISVVAIQKGPFKGPKSSSESTLSMSYFNTMYRCSAMKHTLIFSGQFGRIRQKRKENAETACLQSTSELF